MLTPTVLPDYEAVSLTAALSLAARLESSPHALLCLATGSTPVRAYQIFAEHARRAPTLVRFMNVVKLDEWGGIPIDRPATCESYLRKPLLDPLRLHSRYVGFASQPQNPSRECARIQNWLAIHGPIDTCVLGLGINGHLGFNEPADVLQPHAHVASLSPESFAHPMIQDEPVKPTFGLTLGMADILHSRRILLLVSGVSKRVALQRLLDGPISTHFPASFLHLHPNVTLLTDTAAAPS